MSDIFGPVLKAELASHSKASNLAFNEKVKDLQAEGHKIYHFAFGQSPFSVPEPFVRHLKDTASVNDYLNVSGLLQLRKAVVDFHQEWDQVDLDIDSLVVGPGSKELIYLTMAVWGGQVWLPAPAWTTYRPQAQLAGHNPRNLPQTSESGWKLEPALLEQAVSQVDGPHLVVLTNPGNPSGCSYTRSELESLTAVCRKHKIVIISDEIYARIQYEGSHVCMSQVYPEGTILTSGFSKWSSAGGWRLGYAHFPPALKQIYTAVISAASHTYSCASANIQHAVARAMEQDKESLKEYIMSVRAVLKCVAGYCHDRLGSVGVTGNIAKGAYYFMPDFSAVRDDLAAAGAVTGQQMCDLMLKQANVALMPSSSFLLGEDDLHVRFCFVNFDGDRCLAELKSRGGWKNYIPDSKFVEELCPDLCQGLESICVWVQKLRADNK